MGNLESMRARSSITLALAGSSSLLLGLVGGWAGTAWDVPRMASGPFNRWTTAGWEHSPLAHEHVVVGASLGVLLGCLTGALIARTRPGRRLACGWLRSHRSAARELSRSIGATSVIGLGVLCAAGLVTWLAPEATDRIDRALAKRMLAPPPLALLLSIVGASFIGVHAARTWGSTSPRTSRRSIRRASLVLLVLLNGLAAYSLPARCRAIYVRARIATAEQRFFAIAVGDGRPGPRHEAVSALRDALDAMRWAPPGFPLDRDEATLREWLSSADSTLNLHPAEAVARR